MTEPDTPEPATPDELPRHTTPTWEMELLISGAAVFAMAKAPGWFAAHLLPLVPRFVTALGAPLTVLSTYLSAAAAILAITFALHLALRAYWIALVGVHSVYPGGVDWKQLHLGPIRRAIAQRSDDGAAAGIERADNRASLVFAFGISMAFALLMLSILLAFSLVVAWLVGATTHVHFDALYLFGAIFLVWMTPLFVATTIDRRVGARLREGSRAWRALAAVLSIYARLGVLRASSSAGKTLESHLGVRRFAILSWIALAPVIIGVSISFNLRNATIPLGDYAWFPRLSATDPSRLSAAHYNDQRDPVRDPATAYIPSEVVTGPYLKLMVPFVPARENRALRDACPTAAGAHGQSARADAILACLDTLHPVSLDGKPLTVLHYAITRDPRMDRPALQAMIDVRALAPGRHVLQIGRAPLPASRDRGDNTPVWTIAFWR